MGLIHPELLHSTHIHQDEEATITYNKANTASVKIYADGSSIDRGVGAVAVLFINNTPQQSLQHYLCPEKHHTVDEAELVGLTLAAALLQQLDFLEDASIAIDNQVAITAMTNHYSAPGQQLTGQTSSKAARQHLIHHSNHLMTLPSAQQDSLLNQFLQVN